MSDFESKKSLVKKIENYLDKKIINNPELSDDQKSLRVIIYSSCFCACIAIQPLPFADIFILSPIQMVMVYLISKIRDKKNQKDKKAMDRIEKLFKEMGLVLLGGQFAQFSVITLYKVGLPFLGGFMTIPLVFTLTYAMGKAFDFYFRSLTQKTLDESKEELKEVFKDSKKEAKYIMQKIRKIVVKKEIKKIFKDKSLTYWERLKKAVEMLAEKIDDKIN